LGVYINMWRNTKKIRVIGAALVLFLAMITSVFGIGIKSNIVNQKVNNQVFQVNQIDETTMEIIVNPPDLKFSNIQTITGEYSTLELPNEGYTTKIGEAKLPTITRMIEIPQDSEPEIKIKSTSWEYISLDEAHLPKMIVPVQPPVPKIPNVNQEFVINDEYYNMYAFLPNEIAKITETGEIRSHRFALLEVSPVQYNPSTGELKIITSCTLQINLPHSDIEQTLTNIERYSTSSFEPLLQKTFVNYGYYENFVYDTPKRQDGYLIIVYDSFFDNIQPFASWKDGKGFDTTVTKTSEISGGPTKENIKAYIVDAYTNWPNPPTYVLLVGDTAQIPAWTGSSTGTCTDLYYVTIDSGNYFADIIISRFPAATPEHVTNMVDKTIYYEQGSFESYEWIKKAVFMASEDNYQISEGTHNYVIDTYLNPNGYTCDKLYCHTYDATTQQVTNALNNGRSLAIYSGHGGTDYWADGPVFHQSDVNALINDGMYPFVCSHACVTGTFSASECFGETWLRAQNKAGLAFWGASDNTYWDEDDILERRMFKAWWEDNLETIGGMTNMALYYLYQYYGGGGSSQYYFEAYNVLGDSSVKIWRNNPSNAPNKPSTPSGPSLGILNTDYTFTSSTTEPDGEDVYYMFDWDDGTNSGWIGPYSSGDTVSALHSWTNIGDYNVKVAAKDTNGAQSQWSDPLTITITDNIPPTAPDVQGPASGKPGVQYLYNLVSTDAENHEIYYFLDWGDGTTSDWFGPYDSGETAHKTHAWEQAGTYVVKAKAKDSMGGESDWTTISVTMPLNINSTKSLLLYNLVLLRHQTII